MTHEIQRPSLECNDQQMSADRGEITGININHPGVKLENPGRTKLVNTNRLLPRPFVLPDHQQ